MDVLTLLDKLDDVIYQARPVPLTDQVRIDRGDVYSLLDQIRLSLPDEIKHARWMISERQELLNDGAQGGQLGELMDSIEELKRSQRSSPPPLTAAAAEKVRSIVEAAEASAADVREEAERDARRIQTDAQRRAREIREQAAAEAEGHIKRAEEMTRTLLDEAGTASASVDALLERVRGPAASLTQALGDGAGQILADFDRMRTRMAAELRPEGVAGVVATPRDHAATVGDADLGAGDATNEWSWVEALEAQGHRFDPAATDAELAYDGEIDPEDEELDPEDEFDSALPGPDAHVSASRAGEEEPFGEGDAADARIARNH